MADTSPYLSPRQPGWQGNVYTSPEMAQWIQAAQSVAPGLAVGGEAPQAGNPMIAALGQPPAGHPPVGGNPMLHFVTSGDGTMQSLDENGVASPTTAPAAQAMISRLTGGIPGYEDMARMLAPGTDPNSWEASARVRSGTDQLLGRGINPGLQAAAEMGHLGVAGGQLGVAQQAENRQQNQFNYQTGLRAYLKDSTSEFIRATGRMPGEADMGDLINRAHQAYMASIPAGGGQGINSGGIGGAPTPYSAPLAQLPSTARDLYAAIGGGNSPRDTVAEQFLTQSSGQNPQHFWSHLPAYLGTAASLPEGRVSLARYLNPAMLDPRMPLGNTLGRAGLWPQNPSQGLSQKIGQSIGLSTSLLGGGDQKLYDYLDRLGAAPGQAQPSGDPRQYAYGYPPPR